MKQFKVFIDEEARAWFKTELVVKANSEEEIRTLMNEDRLWTDAEDLWVEDSKFIDIEETINFDYADAYIEKIKD